MSIEKYKFDGQTDCVLEKFNSIGELIETVKRREVRTDVPYYSDVRLMFDAIKNPKEREKIFDWSGGVYYQEAWKMLEQGWVGDLEASKIKGVINHKPSPRRKAVCDVVGYAPIVANHLKGLPNSMIRTEKIDGVRKIIDIYYDVSIYASISSKRKIEAGARFFSYIVELEKMGYSINLYACASHATTDRKKAYLMCVRVKKDNELLNLRKAMFPIVHTAFQRIIEFDWVNTCPLCEWIPGLGYCTNVFFSGDDKIKAYTGDKTPADYFKIKNGIYFDYMDCTSDERLQGKINEWAGKQKGKKVNC